MKVSEICLGTMMFGGHTDAARGAAHHRPRRGQRRQLHRHRQRLHRGALGGRDRPRHQGQARPLGAGDQGRAIDRAQHHRPRPVAPPPDAGRRGQPQAAADRPHRLYYIHRVDPDTAWEETIAAFGDLIRQGKIRAWALSNVKSWHIPHVHHLCRQLGVPQPAALQPYYNLMNRQPEVELLPAATHVRPRRRALQPARARRADRQVQGQPEGRARQPRRAPGPAHAGIGVAPREPDRRREAQGARREARHHAGGLGVGLGAQQPRHQLHHRGPAHLRAVGELLRRARLQVDRPRTRRSPTASSCRATPPRLASSIRPIRSRGGSLRWVQAKKTVAHMSSAHRQNCDVIPAQAGTHASLRTCSARCRGCPPTRA